MSIQSLVGRCKKWWILVLILALIVMPVIGNTSCESGIPLYLFIQAAVCGIQVYQDGNYQGTLEFAKEWGYCMLQFPTTEGMHTLQFIVPGSAVAATSQMAQMKQTAGKVPDIKVTYEGPLVDGGHYNVSFGQDSAPPEGQPTQMAQQSQDKTIIVKASRHPFQPNPTPIQMYTLSTNVSPSSGGSISPAGGQYSLGTQVTLTANPAIGYAFSHWSGNASGSSSTITVTMDSSKIITANFISITPPPPPPATPISNQPPQISSLIANPSGILYGGSTTITCIATDPDGDMVGYTWIANEGSITGVGNSITWTAPNKSGQYNVTVTVSDDKGGSVQAIIPITVSANRSPIISSLVANPSEILYEGSTILTCIATDPDGDTVRYTWSASEGSITGVGSSVTWTAPNRSGQYSVTVIVSDSKGGQTQDNVTVTVSQPPSPPAPTTYPAATYTNDKYGFSIQYPSAWVTRPEMLTNPILVAAFGVSGFVPGVVLSVYDAPAAESADWIVSSLLQAGNTNPTVLSDIKNETLGGNPAYTYEAGYLSANGYDIKSYILDADKADKRIRVNVFTIDAFAPYNATLFSEIAHTLIFK
jgi:hypothetical protein